MRYTPVELDPCFKIFEGIFTPDFGRHSLSGIVVPLSHSA